MHFLFVTYDLIGNINCAESLASYHHYVDWCINNLEQDQWELDYTETVCVFGEQVAGAIRINNIKDALNFCKA